MKKYLLSVVLSLALISGCGVKQSSQELISTALAMPPVVGTNHSKGFLKYYLNPDVGLRASTQTSSLLVIDQVEVMMSVKVSNIVADYYKEDASPLQKQMVSFEEGETIEGMYLDPQNVQRKYVYNEKNFGDKIGITLDNGLVSIVALIYPAQKAILIPSMVSVMRSTLVNETLVVAHYSNKEVIEYDTIHRDFFEQEIPESGSLIDMYNQMNPNDKIE